MATRKAQLKIIYFTACFFIGATIAISQNLNGFADSDITDAPEISEPQEFTDVSVGDPYYMAINHLKAKGIIKGYEDGSYKPNNWINRAETLKILTLGSEIFKEDELGKISADSVEPFSDTPVDAWYMKYLYPSLELGIISGYPDGTFKPGNDINLAETLKIFFESIDDIDYGNTEENLYNDTPLNEWFTKYTAYAGSKGIINIYPSNTVSPDQMMSRGYLAEIIYRYEKSLEGYGFGKSTWYGAAVQGNNTASGETFDLNKLTAAHKYLPFGTMVEVTNLANGKSVVVTITDRGPYGPGRVIDLTSSAFSEIAWTGTGIIDVQYKVVYLP
ncbi:MAG: septal ring lytic transglycosylase RlpA family protein [bacterium]|nr:septal ring lytic transglycosylase RlpA family protein [bacterium]